MNCDLAIDSDQLPSLPKRRRAGLMAIALGLTIMALASELVTMGSGHRAFQARRNLLQGQSLQALQAVTGGVCQLTPFNQDSQYTRLVALKNLHRWPELADAAHQVGRWHPEASLIGLIEGEAAWNAGRADQAAQALWQALWQAPAPPHSASALWLTAAWATQSAWGHGDPHLAASVCQVLAHLDDSSLTASAQRFQLLSEARALFDQAGLPEAAGAIASRMATPEH